MPGDLDPYPSIGEPRYPLTGSHSAREHGTLRLVPKSVFGAPTTDRLEPRAPSASENAFDKSQMRQACQSPEEGIEQAQPKPLHPAAAEDLRERRLADDRPYFRHAPKHVAVHCPHECVLCQMSPVSSYRLGTRQRRPAGGQVLVHDVEIRFPRRSQPTVQLIRIAVAPPITEQMLAEDCHRIRARDPKEHLEVRRDGIVAPAIRPDCPVDRGPDHATRSRKETVLVAQQRVQ